MSGGDEELVNNNRLQMFFYFLSIAVVLLSLYLWKNKHFFSGDILKDYGNNPKVPFVKNGFDLALMTPGKNLIAMPTGI